MLNVCGIVWLQVSKEGSCPYRPAEKHVHNDAFSNYGAGESSLKITDDQHQASITQQQVLGDDTCFVWQHIAAAPQLQEQAVKAAAASCDSLLPVLGCACFAAGVALSLDGRLLIVGAPTAWDNNMDCQSGAVYLIDVDEVRQ